MPEGHTIHRLANDQNKSIGRQKLHVSSPQGRFEEEAAVLDGRTLRKIDAFGKHLFYRFSGGLILHVHLGLFGKYRTQKSPPDEPRGAVRVRFESATHTVDLNGPNTCEIVTKKKYDEIVARLGPDPLRGDADSSLAWKRIHASKTPIGLLLMDQSVMAGIGNIYRSEILHLIGVHPKRPGNELTKAQFNKLWKLAVELLKLGVKHNRIITIDAKSLPKTDAALARLSRKKLFRIFKKDACPQCNGEIERFTLASRKVFACPVCQRSTV